jgi:hypothetical protein
MSSVICRSAYCNPKNPKRVTARLAAAATSAVRAELIGANATALGITATGPAPVLALCRELLAAGVDPDQCLEVYRGAVVALRIRTITEGARLTVKDNRLGRPVFARWQDRAASDAAAPPIAPTAPLDIGGAD